MKLNLSEEITARETEVLRMLAEGLVIAASCSTGQIAPESHGPHPSKKSDCHGVLKNGRTLRQPLVKDDICINPPGSYADLTVPQLSSVPSLSLSSFNPEAMAALLDEHVQAKHVEALAKHGFRDHVLLQLSLLLEEEAATGGQNGRLYAEGLSTALVARFMNCFSAHPFSPAQYKGGLPGYALRQVCVHMEAHLAHDVSLAQLARIAGMSSYHFARLFRQSTGLPAHQYLTSLRLRRARELLVKSSLPLAEISREVGYESQSHFTAVFRKATGSTPKVFRSQYRR
jgi:AraC family transcriptional regulator